MFSVWKNDGVINLDGQTASMHFVKLGRLWKKYLRFRARVSQVTADKRVLLSTYVCHVSRLSRVAADERVSPGGGGEREAARCVHVLHRAHRVSPGPRAHVRAQGRT